jgi:predicted secreted protein
MSWITSLAVYFVIWWITLFIVLPIGVRTQAEQQDITLGTTESAPQKHNVPFKLLMTTVLAAVFFCLYYVIVSVFGVGFESIPRIVPNFSGR